MSVFIETEDFINCGKDSTGGNAATATETTITWSGSGNIIKRYQPDTGFNLPSGSQYAEDTPNGMAKEDSIILSGPASNTQYAAKFHKRAPFAFNLQKVVFNLAFGVYLSTNNNDAQFNSVDVGFYYVFGGQQIAITPFAKAISTGHALSSGGGTPCYIFLYEQSYTPNVNVPQSAWLIVDVKINSTAGTSTRQEGMFSIFSYFKTNATKQFSLSGVYLYGRAT